MSQLSKPHRSFCLLVLTQLYQHPGHLLTSQLKRLVIVLIKMTNLGEHASFLLSDGCFGSNTVFLISFCQSTENTDRTSLAPTTDMSVSANRIYSLGTNKMCQSVLGF